MENALSERSESKGQPSLALANAPASPIFFFFFFKKPERSIWMLGLVALAWWGWSTRTTFPQSWDAVNFTWRSSGSTWSSIVLIRRDIWGSLPSHALLSFVTPMDTARWSSGMSSPPWRWWGCALP